MRIGVYDEHWETFGGGEKLAASYAKALRGFGDVELIGHSPVDLPMLEERLNVDLDSVRVAVVGRGAEAVSAASADYDLFVNCSYLSKVTNRAPASMYVVQFPERPPDGGSSSGRFLLEHRDLFLRRCDIEFGPGFYPAEAEDSFTYRWTTGDGFLGIRNQCDVAMPLQVTVNAAHCPPGVSRQVTATLDGAVTTHSLADRPVALHFAIEPHAVVDLRIQSDQWSVPSDPRVFGVQVVDVRGGSMINDEIRDIASHAYHLASVYGFVDTYRVVTSISAFTARAVKEYWQRDSVVIAPAVRPRRIGTKQPTIISVGRFFSGGHSKKQIELVEGFRRLRSRGRGGSWTLQLIGGSSVANPYLDQVAIAAEGQPVEIQTNSAGTVLEEALSHATIYWHGAGVGEDLAIAPVAFEHFGISVVEAMSAGCIPVVNGIGGPAEIVEDGRSGLHYFDIDELVRQTELLFVDPTLRDRLRERAIERSNHYSEERFGAEVARAVALALDRRAESADRGN